MTWFEHKFDEHQERLYEIQEANTIAALSGDHIIKTCFGCKFYRPETQSKNSQCSRLQYEGRDPISGEAKLLGRLLYCSIEREIENEFKIGVAEGSLCGAIGQFFSPKPLVVKQERPTWSSKLSKLFKSQPKETQ